MLGARCAEVTAPPGLEVLDVRDAPALIRILARPFALPNVRQCPRRVLEVFLSGTRVALDLGADLHPYGSVLRSVCKCHDWLLSSLSYSIPPYSIYIGWCTPGAHVPFAFVGAVHDIVPVRLSINVS